MGWRRFRTWLAGLSEAGKVGVIAAGITTTGAIAAAVIGGLFQLMAAGAGTTANPSTSSVETTPATITTTTAATTSAPPPSLTTTTATSTSVASRRNVEHVVVPEGQRRSVLGGDLAIAYRTNMLTDDKGWVLYGYVTETATGASLELQQLAVGDQIRFGKKRRYLLTLLCVSPNCEGTLLAAEFEVRRQ